MKHLLTPPTTITCDISEATSLQWDSLSGDDHAGFATDFVLRPLPAPYSPEVIDTSFYNR